MSSNDQNAQKKQMPTGKKPDERIASAIHGSLQNGKLPCARAFKIAQELSVPLIEVGYAADVLKVRIAQCQLGLFGYEPEKCIVQPASSIDSALEESIRAGLKDGRLPCPTAFAIAKDLHIPRMDVSSACETMSIKICSCQLGAFA